MPSLNKLHRSDLNTGSQLSLDDLLRRSDVWRGYSQVFVAQAAVDTGYPVLNNALIHNGWPEACLIELGQPSAAGTWLLFSHAAKHLLGMPSSPDSDPQSNETLKDGSVIVLLNPPAVPYAVALLRLGIPLERLWVVTPHNKSDFIASFVELARCPACSMVMSWQPKQALSYSELRKCQLATHEQSGLYVLFRNESGLRQSSPAALRARVLLGKQHLALEFLKQKGRVPSTKVLLPLPECWLTSEEYKSLGHFKASYSPKNIASHTAAAQSLHAVDLDSPMPKPKY